jgi:hypothetical protein
MYPAFELEIVLRAMMMIRACLSLLIAAVVKDLVTSTRAADSFRRPSFQVNARLGYHLRMSRLPRVLVLKMCCGWLAILSLQLTACSKHHDRAKAPYVPLPELEATFGPLITAGNHPTPDQTGNGQRMGLFRDGEGRSGAFPLRFLTMVRFSVVLRRHCVMHK